CEQPLRRVSCGLSLHEALPISITIVVPAHNEELVIAKTTKGILDLNYPASKIEVLLYADNCQDKTAAEMRKAVDMPEYRYRNVQIIERSEERRVGKE